VGRSNVGKSSLLNALVGRPLARVSATPGKTQLMNAYRLPTFWLLDLPGYGFARADRASRAAYRTMLERLLRERESLSGVVWLLDIRHPPSADDAVFQTLLTQAGRSVLVVLTKADKLAYAQRARMAAERAGELGVDLGQIQIVSSRDRLGINDLAESLLAAAAGGIG
jgi:GTP-binding protein